MKRQILRAGITCLSILCTPVFAQLRGPGTLVFTTSSATVREDAGAIKVSVARINGSRGVVTVNVSTVSGSAIAGQDFVPVNQTLTFANGDAGPRVIKLGILEDQLRERTESFTVLLTHPSGGAAIGTPSVQTIGILDTTVVGLSLTSSVPANGTTGVNRSSPIHLNFSAAIDVATAPGNISLRTVPGGVPVAAALAVSGSQITLTPAVRLDPLAQYATLIDVGLKSTNGAALPSAISIGFTTRDRGWLGAQLVETENLGDASAAQVAFDCNGHAWAVWVQSDGARHGVRASRYVPGSGWQPATAIENNAGDAFSPRLAIDAAGNVFVTWQQKDSAAHYDTWANRYAVGAGWGAPTLIETGAGSSLGAASIAVDPSGNAIAVWPQSSADPSHQDIWANRYVLGSGWGTATLLGPLNAGTSFEPVAGIDGAGNALVTWRQPVVPAGIFNVWSNRFTPGAGWSGPQRIETNTNGVWFPTLAVDAPGNALTLWSQNGAPDDIWYNRYVAGAGWGSAAPFGNSSYSQDAQIGLDAAGNGIAAWRQADSGAIYSLWARSYSAATGWEPAARIDTLAAGTTTVPRIAVSPAGDAIAVWNRQDASSNNVWANRYKGGLGWSAAELLESLADHAFNPQIAMDAAGNAMATWTQFDGTRYNIWSNRFE